MKYRMTRWGAAALGCLALASAGAAFGQGTDLLVLEAREAFGKRDRTRLAELRAGAIASQDELAPWVAYWELNNRLGEATQAELDAFYERWRGTYVEDRLRNDWLLELGKRRDWENFRADFPRFRMNDDREVTCYALLTNHLAGQDVRARAREQWYAQRDSDDGCALLASTLHAEGRLRDADVWHKLRLSMEFSRPRAARLAAELLGPKVAEAVGEIVDQPARYLTRKASTLNRTQAELAALALARMAASDAEAAAAQLDERWQRRLPGDLAAWAWAVTAKQSALKLLPEAHAQFNRAQALSRKAQPAIDWSDDLLAWQARAALRAVSAGDRWQTVLAAIDAMSPSEQRDPAWVYWKARALLALAPRHGEVEANEMRLAARAALLELASPLHFYGQLAAEDLGLQLALPTPQAPSMALDAPAAGPAASTAASSVTAAAPGASAALVASAAPTAPAPVAALAAPTASAVSPASAASAAVAAPATPTAPLAPAAPAAPTAPVALSTPAALAASAALSASAAPAVAASVPVPAASAVQVVATGFDTVRRHPGLSRALRLIGLGLRSEGVREWNYSLRGMNDRELIAAAQWACEREVWDRCINTSDRTRREVNIAQRYPLPHRTELEATATEAGIDLAYVYGLVRQESRFVTDARSHAGASGLMQVMPSTARWVARKIGLRYTHDMIADRDINLKLGTAYLKLVLDDFGGSQAMAAAAYNAGPNRPRRWREGPLLETPIWAENIPFPETRDYVKKVLANAAVYAALIAGRDAPVLKTRLGAGVGPRDTTAPPADGSLP